MDNQNYVFYILGVLVCTLIYTLVLEFTTGRHPAGRQSAGRQSAGRQSAGRQPADEETYVEVPQGYALVELSHDAYRSHRQYVDSLISIDEVSVISDSDNLQLSVPQKSMAGFLEIKHPAQINFSELPWYVHAILVFSCFCGIAAVGLKIWIWQGKPST